MCGYLSPASIRPLVSSTYSEEKESDAHTRRGWDQGSRTSLSSARAGALLGKKRDNCTYLSHRKPNNAGADL